MLRINISIQALTYGDAEDAIAEVKRLVAQEYREGRNENDEASFNFSTTGSEEIRDEEDEEEEDEGVYPEVSREEVQGLLTQIEEILEKDKK